MKNIVKTSEKGDRVKCLVDDLVNGGTKAVMAIITRIVYFRGAVYCIEVKTDEGVGETSRGILANYG